MILSCRIVQYMARCLNIDMSAFCIPVFPWPLTAAKHIPRNRSVSPGEKFGDKMSFGSKGEALGRINSCFPSRGVKIPWRGFRNTTVQREKVKPRSFPALWKIRLPGEIQSCWLPRTGCRKASYQKDLITAITQKHLWVDSRVCSKFSVTKLLPVTSKEYLIRPWKRTS